MASAYPTIRRKIASIVTSTTPDHDAAHFNGAFRELDAGWMDDERAIPQGRDFLIEMASGVTQNPHCFASAGRMKVGLVLSVIYPDDTADFISLDEVLGSDAENLVAQLLEPDNWDRGSSGIELVGARGSNGHEALPFDIIADDGFRVLQIAFDVTYRRGAETN